MKLIEALQLRRKPKPNKQQQIEAIAHQLYLNRLETGTDGNEHSDWEKAVSIFRDPARKLIFYLNQPLIRTEKKAVEPVANWLDRADLFRIIGVVPA